MNNLDLNTQLGVLNTKRHALEQGLHIAALIERLNRSLNATLVAKQPGSSLPTEALQYYEALDGFSRALPTPLLKKRIAGLGEELQGDFRHILFITRMIKGVETQPSSTSDVNDVDVFLTRFTDHSARLVGLRVALYKKGESSEALKLSIPTELLTRRLQAVSSLEQNCRVKVRNEIKSLRRDTRQLLKAPNLLEGMRNELQGILDDLQTSLQHIDSGGDIAEIPVLVETLSWDQTPMSTTELSELLRGEEVEEIPLEEITITALPDAPEPAFRDTLHYWLNTPLDVSWDTVKHWQKKRSSPD